MKIFVFGNPDLKFDKIPQKLIQKLEKDFNNQVIFEYVKPNEDLPFENSPNVVILDIIRHLKIPKLLNETHINNILEGPRTSVHDFDLGFQLKYLLKLGKLQKVSIIGIPMSYAIEENSESTCKESEKALPYSSIHSIVKKLVAQDIQGS
jgi:hypothetical protein